MNVTLNHKLQESSQKKKKGGSWGEKFEYLWSRLLTFHPIENSWRILKLRVRVTIEEEDLSREIS